MKNVSSTLKGLALVIFMLALASIANAQASRTWVSGVGDDANPCSRTAPCKTFPGAYSKTAAGGEIDALDPGGFGTVTISKAITLDGGGGQVASILASGGPGVTVNGAATDVVILRHLRMQGLRQYSFPATNGINFNSGKLVVENCFIFGFVNGINAAANGSLSVRDTVIENNSGDGIRLANNGSGAMNALLDNVRSENNGTNGIEIVAISVAQIRNSTFSANTTAGLNISNSSSSANVQNSYFQGSPSNGIIATAGTVHIGGNFITNNGVGGVNCSGGTIQSFLDNDITGNATNIVGCSDPLPQIVKK
jgi:hypothetical protein